MPPAQKHIDPNIATDDALPPVLTVRQAAEMLACSVATLYTKLASGKLHAIKDGTRTLVLRQSVVDYLGNLPPARFQRTPHHAHVREPA